jgi:hypothetical protein
MSRSYTFSPPAPPYVCVVGLPFIKYAKGGKDVHCGFLRYDAVMEPILLFIFLSPSRQMMGKYLKLGHHHFLPYLFQFIIHLSFFNFMLYSLCELLRKRR